MKKEVIASCDKYKELNHEEYRRIVRIARKKNYEKHNISKIIAVIKSGKKSENN